MLLIFRMSPIWDQHSYTVMLQGIRKEGTPWSINLEVWKEWLKLWFQGQPKNGYQVEWNYSIRKSFTRIQSCRSNPNGLTQCMEHLFCRSSLTAKSMPRKARLVFSELISLYSCILLIVCLCPLPTVVNCCAVVVQLFLNMNLPRNYSFRRRRNVYLESVRRVALLFILK